ncbi:MAG: glycosyltransferase family 4 protein [Candidatus Bathyarchaeota archaeon]|nr:glycosyltransferase family 4 protein [Candidatus Bathyarchaeota archaeon]
MSQSQHGNDVAVMTSSRKGKTVEIMLGEDARKLERKGKSIEEEILVYRLPQLIDIFDTPLTICGLKAVLKDFKPEVVHCHDLFYPTLLQLAHLKRQFNYCLFVDSITGIFSPGLWRKSAYIFFQKCIFPLIDPKVDVYFAVSGGSARWLRKHFRVSEHRIVISRHGVDVELFKPNIKAKNDTRKELGITKDQILLVYSGKVVLGKDLEILFYALSKIRPLLLRKLRVVLVGNGVDEYMRFLRSIMDRSLISKIVQFLPTVYRKKLAKYYNAADIAIWPGDPSISILEAMACGIPVIAPTYEPPRDDAFDNEFYIKTAKMPTFKRGDAGKLADLLEKLILDEDLRRDYGMNAVNLIFKSLNWEIITERMEHIYRSSACTRLAQKDAHINQ